MGWSGGAKVLGKLPVPGRPTIWMVVGQGPIALAVGAGGGYLDIFTFRYLFSSPSPSLWEAARYCLKGPLNPKQPILEGIYFNIFDELLMTNVSHRLDKNIPFYRCLRISYPGLLSQPRL